LPISVALVKNKTLQSATFRAHGGGHSVDIAYYDALTAAIHGALAHVFSATRLVDDPTAAAKNEVLAEYGLKYRETYRNDWSGHYGFETLLTVRLKDSDSGLLIAEAQHIEQVRYAPPPEATAAAVVTGGSLFLLSPITIPLTTIAVGREAERLIGEAIKTSVTAIGEKLLTDSRLIARARAIDIGAAVPAAGATTPTASGSPAQPPSKYDDFLNAVAVVRSSKGVASGFFVNSTGTLLTNHHVVGSDATVSVKLRSGTVTIGTVIAADSGSDLALVSIPQPSPAWLELARRDEGGVGADVIAIGTPEGLSWSVSKGIVSAFRDLSGTQVVQTDAPINKGNSGGPVILLESGRVVGIASFGIRKDVAEGLNFAVAAPTILAVFSQYLTR
jgi:S1-C subfamily serine protease